MDDNDDDHGSSRPEVFCEIAALNLISKFTAKYYAKFAVAWHNNLMASIYESVVIKPTYNHNILKI